MTKVEIEQSYDVEAGRICSPGKFEGEPVYSPYYWERALSGEADEETPTEYAFFVTDDEKAMFEGLRYAWKVTLTQDENGFVYCISHFD